MQMKLSVRYLAKAARHPVVEEWPVGSHRENQTFRELVTSGGTELFDVTIGHPLGRLEATAPKQERKLKQNKEWFTAGDSFSKTLRRIQYAYKKLC